MYNKIGNPIDFGELAYVTSLNTVLRILLGGGTIQGEKWTNFVAQFRCHAAEMMVLFGKPNVSDLFPVLARYDLQGIERQSKRLAVTLDQFLESRITGSCWSEQHRRRIPLAQVTVFGCCDEGDISFASCTASLSAPFFRAIMHTRRVYRS